MTNTGLFEDPDKITYLENQNKLLRLKLKEAISKIKKNTRIGRDPFKY
jgi:hypothetical protein